MFIHMSEYLNMRIHIYIYVNYIYVYICKLYIYILFQPVSSISVTPSVNVVPCVLLNVLKISLCKKPCCS